MSHRIVIVGGGFAGALAARLLGQRHDPDLDILLIDTKDEFLFAPRLIDALATSSTESKRWSASLEDLGKKFGFRFLRGKVEHVHQEGKTLTVFSDQTGSRAIPYDTLILSPGAKTCYYGIKGAEEHALALKNSDDVVRIHQQVESLLRQAQQVTEPQAKRQLLSFVVVGAGPSGVEGIFALRTYLETWCKRHDPALFAFASFSLIQAGPQILPGFPLKMVHTISEELLRYKIRIFIGEAVTEITQNSLTTNLKHTLPTSLILWTAGIQPNSIPLEPDVHRDQAGYLIADNFLQVAPNVFAAGDTILYRENNQVVPRNAQTAILMGRTIARNILRSIRHHTLQPFTYSSKGNILVIGKTGCIDIKVTSFQTRFAPLIRDLLYRFRFWQLTGKF